VSDISFEEENNDRVTENDKKCMNSREEMQKKVDPQFYRFYEQLICIKFHVSFYWKFYLTYLASAKSLQSYQ